MHSKITSALAVCVCAPNQPAVKLIPASRVPCGTACSNTMLHNGLPLRAHDASSFLTPASPPASLLPPSSRAHARRRRRPRPRRRRSGRRPLPPWPRPWHAGSSPWRHQGAPSASRGWGSRDPSLPEPERRLLERRPLRLPPTCPWWCSPPRARHPCGAGRGCCRPRRRRRRRRPQGSEAALRAMRRTWASTPAPTT